MNFDVFNGDADGICALHQLRLAEPRQALLVSGVKRDIKLLKKVEAQAEARITVLDISLASNRNELLHLLETCQVFYVDHHYAGEIPASANLEAHIDPNPEICTSLIVDRLLGGRYRSWAVAAAFGDNLHESARAAAAPLHLSAPELEKLREIGELMNYNGYGFEVEDLYYSPQALYEAVKPFENPLDFYEHAGVLGELRQGFQNDMEQAYRHEPFIDGPAGRIFIFPAGAWPRRVAGVFSNEKARERQNQAHAVLVDNHDSTYMVSVRAPLVSKKRADELCLRYPTGGGRAAAAGINALPKEKLMDFIQAFEKIFVPYTEE